MQDENQQGNEANTDPTEAAFLRQRLEALESRR